MLDVEVFGWALASGAPPVDEVRRLCDEAAASAGVREGHVAIEFVDEGRITELNHAHRALPEPTDVLSFPIDGAGPLHAGEAPAPGSGRADVVAGGGSVTRELGDVVICPAHTADLREAIVHGVLHLLGMDHETDDGEMLALQRRLLRRSGE
jgi:probable rRNA maturation factor